MTMTLISIETLKKLKALSEMALAEDFAIYDATNGLAVSEAEYLINDPLRPTVVCNITGGVLQGASANCNVDVYALDFEIDSCDDNLVEIEGSDAYRYETSAVVEPAFVNEVIKAAPDPEIQFPPEDWRYEVMNGDTRLGYEAWLQHKIESQ